MDEAETIRRFGYDVIAVHDGEAAERTATGDARVDLVLMDIDLGSGIDGTESARRILQKRTVPIVFLTSHAEREMVDRVKGITRYGYIIKNSGSFVLRSSIEMAFELFAAHERLSESESRLRTLVQTIPDLIWLKDVNGVYISCNYMFERFFGAPEAEIVGRTDYDFVDRGLADLFREYDRKAMEAGRPSINEEWITFASDGRRAYLETIKTPMYGSDGHLIGVLGIARDITARKHAEDSLNATLRQMHDIIEFLPDPTFVIDGDGKVIAWNRAMVELSGSPKEEMLGQGDYCYALPFYKERRPILINLAGISSAELEAKYDYVRRVENVVYAETYVAHMNNGTGAYLWGAAVPLFDSKGDRIGAVEVIRDITERKRAEDRLNAALRQMHDIIDFLPDPTFVIDKDRNVFAWNRAMEELTGVKKSEILGKGEYEYALPFYNERRPMLIDMVDFPDSALEAKYNTIVHDGRRIYAETFFQHLKKGTGAYLSGVAAPLFDSSGGRIGAIEVIRDITERKRIEEALMASEARYRSLVEMSLVGVYIIQEGLFRFVNKRFCEIFGYSYEEIVDRLGPDDLTYSEDRNLVNEYIRKRINGEIRSVEYEFRSVTKGGSVIPVRVVGGGFMYQGKPAIMGTLSDITGQKRAEEALHESETQYRELVERSLVGVYVIQDGLYRFVNKKYCELIGYDAEEVVDKLNPLEIIHPDDREKVAENIRRRIAGEVDALEYEIKVVRKNGEIVFIKVLGGRMTYWGRPAIMGTAIDITVQIRAEEALHESEAKYRDIVERSLVGVYIIQDNLFRFANKRYCEMIGYAPEEVVDKLNAIEITHPDDRKTVEENIRRRISGEVDALEYEIKTMRKDGGFIHAKVLGRRVLYRGRPAIMGTVVDITAQKRAEDSLRNSEAFLNSIIEYSPYPMWISDERGTLIRMNQACRDLLHVTDDDLVGKYTILEDSIVEEQGFMPLVRKVFETGETVRFAIHYESEWLKSIQLEKTASVDLDVTISAVRNANGKVAHAVVQHIDITDLKNIQKQLMRSNSDKEILLKEMQHRMKNTLGIVSGLLSLEMNKISDPDTRHVFQKSITRIQTISRVYQQLYQADGLNTIGLGQYISELANRLLSTYVHDSDMVQLTFELEDVTIDIKRAMNVGLILNELITNSVKYAFTSGEKGAIHIDLAIKGGSVVITVSDNGKGCIPVQNSDEGKGTGLHIVELLSKELGGSFTITCQQGTVARLEFTLNSRSGE